MAKFNNKEEAIEVLKQLPEAEIKRVAEIATHPKVKPYLTNSFMFMGMKTQLDNL